MKKRSINKIYNLIFPLSVVVLILILWFVFNKSVNEEIIVPSIKNTFNEMGKLIVSSGFYKSFGATFLRIIISFSISFVSALLFAILSYKINVAEKILKPFIAIIRAVPTVAVILWFVLWLNSKVTACIVTVLVIFPMMYESIFISLKTIDKDLLEMLKIYKINNKDIFSKYIFPYILPDVLDGIGAGLSFNIKLMVSSEVLASTVNSLGAMMQISKIYFETARLMALTVITVVIALLIELIFHLLAKVVSARWKK